MHEVRGGFSVKLMKLKFRAFYLHRPLHNLFNLPCICSFVFLFLKRPPPKWYQKHTPQYLDPPCMSAIPAFDGSPVIV